MELFNYKGKVIRVVDGDTVKINIDLGFTIFWESNCRMAGINTDELKSKDEALKDSALKAKAYLETILKPGDTVLIKSKALDRYKRPIVQIITEKGLNLNEDMITKGYAKPYMV